MGSCKVYAPVNPHTKYMRIYGTARESEMMKIVTDFQWSNRRPAVLNLSGTKPRPFLEISDQGQLRSKGSKKNSVMKVVNRRSAGERVQEPPSPHLQFRYPHCVPILLPMVLDRSHNLRMVREGRTNVTILVKAARQSSASGKCLPGPAVRLDRVVMTPSMMNQLLLKLK